MIQLSERDFSNRARDQVDLDKTTLSVLIPSSAIGYRSISQVYPSPREFPKLPRARVSQMRLYSSERVIEKELLKKRTEF